MYGKLSHRSFCSITAVSHVPKQFSCSYIISYFQVCIRVQMRVVVISTTITYDTNPPTTFFKPALIFHRSVTDAHHRIQPPFIFSRHNICSFMPPLSAIITFHMPGVHKTYFQRFIHIRLWNREIQGLFFHILHRLPAC